MKKDESIKLHGISTSRRALLGGIGAASGLAVTRAASWFDDDASSLNFNELFVELQQSLSPTQRKHTFLSSHDPVRQVTLTESVQKSPHIGTLYNSYQASLIRKMYRQMLSAQGLSWMQNTISLEGRFEGSIFKIYSRDIERATTQNSQVVINGGHYMLRSNDLAGSGYALGGPVSYGQQIGNNKYQVKGNAFKAHGDALNQFHQALSAKERQVAYQDLAPYELLLQIQGVDGVFPGVRIGDVSFAAQEVAQDMLGTIFAGFPTAQQSEVWTAINDNGGLESLHVAMYRDYSFYQDGARYDDLNLQQRSARSAPYVHAWRIEGPAFVIHFKGFPHVHAYMNIVIDPTRIAIGEALTETKRSLGQHEVSQLIISMLTERTKQPIAFYPKSLVSRISPGIISTGSIYTLDPFANEIVVAEVSPETMSAELRNSLSVQGVQPIAGGRYHIATIGYMLRREDLFGVPENVTYTGESVRDQLIDFVTDKNLGELFG